MHPVIAILLIIGIFLGLGWAPLAVGIAWLAVDPNDQKAGLGRVMTFFMMTCVFGWITFFVFWGAWAFLPAFALGKWLTAYGAMTGFFVIVATIVWWRQS